MNILAHVKSPRSLFRLFIDLIVVSIRRNIKKERDTNTEALHTSEQDTFLGKQKNIIMFSTRTNKECSVVCEYIIPFNFAVDYHFVTTTKQNYRSSSRTRATSKFELDAWTMECSWGLRVHDGGHDERCKQLEWGPRQIDSEEQTRIRVFFELPTAVHWRPQSCFLFKQHRGKNKLVRATVNSYYSNVYKHKWEQWQHNSGTIQKWQSPTVHGHAPQSTIRLRPTEFIHKHT